MNKTEFTKYIAGKHDIAQKEANKIADIFIGSVIDALQEGNEINLIGFGSFSIAKIAERQGRNVRTGEAIKVPAHNRCKFKVGRKLKDAVNEES